MLTCPACRKQIRPTSKFCDYCGQRMGQAADPIPPQDVRVDASKEFDARFATHPPEPEDDLRQAAYSDSLHVPAPILKIHEVKLRQVGQPFELACSVRWDGSAEEPPELEYRIETAGKNEYRLFPFGVEQRILFQVRDVMLMDFTIEFTIQAKGLGKYEGAYRVTVDDEQPSGPTSYHFHQTTTARNAVGNENIFNFHTPSSQASRGGGQLIEIPLTCQAAIQQPPTSTRKRPWQMPDPHKPAHDRLSLRFRHKEITKNLCLIGGREVSLGKQRECDIVLRLLPPDRLEQHWSRISRKHATLGFTPTGVEWRNADCRHGTLSNGQALKPGETVPLKPIHELRPADVLGLRCMSFSNEFLTGEDYAYNRFATEIGKPAIPREPIGPVAAMRITRTDNFTALEEYILIQHGCTLGRDSGNAIVVSHPSISMRHALLLFTNQGFWIEPLQQNVIRVDGKAVSQHHLVQLRPGMILHIGEVEMTVNNKSQWYIDLLPSE